MTTFHNTRLVLYFVLLIIAMVVVRFVLGGPEDEWRCVGADWVRHGQPAGPKPTQPCE